MSFIQTGHYKFCNCEHNHTGIGSRIRRYGREMEIGGGGFQYKNGKSQHTDKMY